MTVDTKPPAGSDADARVDLRSDRPIDTNAVETICRLPDDLYRLRWVSYAYYDLSRRLDDKLGSATNATWPAFARWSAYTISEALRLDRPNPRLEEVLKDHMIPEKLVEPLVAVQRRLRSLDDGAMPTVLALGNRLVFHEVGWTIASFLDFMGGPDAADADKAAEFCGRIQPSKPDDFFRPCYPEWLRDGVFAYYKASRTNDAHEKAELVLRGNILIGAYEQWRVDSFFEVALDFNPGALVKDLRAGPHDAPGTRQVGVRHAGTRRAMRHQWAALDWMSDAYAAFLTRFVMTWDAPLFSAKPTALRLGSDVPRVRRSALDVNNPARGVYDLSELDPALARLFSTFDRSGGQLRGSGARNWRRFTDRMSFIANLFRSQQQNENLKVPPSILEERLLALKLNDADLDWLRGEGDDKQAALRARVAIPPEGTARADGSKPYEVVDRSTLKLEPLPAWVDPATIAKGQKFFAKYQMEIASALFCASLPMAYTAERGARVLYETAELISDVSRRISETGRLLFDVMMPDPKVGEDKTFEAGSHAYNSIVTVRAYHAVIRDKLQGQEPWKSEWNYPMTRRRSQSADIDLVEEQAASTQTVEGSAEDAAEESKPRPEVPINQEDLLGTLATFTVVVIESLEKMGIKTSKEERENYLHAWLAAGHLLGIRYELLRDRTPTDKKTQPLSYFEMQLLRDSIFRRQAAPSPSGQILTRALLGLQEAALPTVLRPLPPAAIRRFIGDDAADMLEVPPAGPVRVVLDALGPVGSAAQEVAQGRVTRPALAQMATRMFQHWMAEELGTSRAWTAQVPTAFTAFKPDLADAKAKLKKAGRVWED